MALDLITYALLKNKIAAASSGVVGAAIENGKLIIELSDGTKLESPIDTGLASATLEGGNLVLTNSDGTTLSVPVLDQASQTKLNDLPPFSSVGNGLAIDSNGQLICQFSILNGGSAYNGN